MGHSRAHEVATKAPIVTVVPFGAINDGATEFMLSNSKATSTALEVEMLMKWGPSKYYYILQAVPAFGDFAFFYSGGTEAGLPGSATPFDTGGVFKQRCAPTNCAEPCDLLELTRKMISDHSVDLDRFRQALEHYIDSQYESVDSFVKSEPPNPEGNEDGQTQNKTTRGPHLIKENHDAGDWPSWTWEVRIEQALPIKDNLWLTACSENVLSRYQGEIISSGIIQGEEPFLLLEKISRTAITGKTPVDAFEKALEEVRSRL